MIGVYIDTCNRTCRKISPFSLLKEAILLSNITTGHWEVHEAPVK